jgi:hypothetical protein
VFIPKALKVVCFDTLLQVLILNGLAREKCTKIVQVSEALQTKGLGSGRGKTHRLPRKQKRTGKSACATKRRQDAGGMGIRHNVTQGLLYTKGNFCQEELHSRFGTRGEGRKAIGRNGLRVGDVAVRLGAL